MSCQSMTKGIAMNVGDIGQELQNLIACRAVAKGGGSFSAKRIDGFELLLADFAVKEQQGMKGLVLGAGRQARQSEMGEEVLDFLFCSKRDIGFLVVQKGRRSG